MRKVHSLRPRNLLSHQAKQRWPLSRRNKPSRSLKTTIKIVSWSQSSVLTKIRARKSLRMTPLKRMMSQFKETMVKPAAWYQGAWGIPFGTTRRMISSWISLSSRTRVTAGMLRVWTPMTVRVDDLLKMMMKIPLKVTSLMRTATILSWWRTVWIALPALPVKSL